jgi:hypothetical protein
MNVWSLRASRMVRVTRGSRVTFTEGQRTKFGTVVQVMHDKFRIVGEDGCTRSILHERVEGLTPIEPKE